MSGYRGQELIPRQMAIDESCEWLDLSTVLSGAPDGQMNAVGLPVPCRTCWYRKQEALQCLPESLYLANIDQSTEASGRGNGTPDVLLRDAAGWLHLMQVKGPFAVRIDDLLEEVSRSRSA